MKESLFKFPSTPHLATITGVNRGDKVLSKSGRDKFLQHNRKRYRGRNGIERMFRRLKDFRRIATRHDKNAENLMAAVCLRA